jgi:hypothetical protein
MRNGNSANFDLRLTKLENSKCGVPANLAGFRIRKITVREGDDVDQVIKAMEARGEIQPVPADFPLATSARLCIGLLIGPSAINRWPASKGRCYRGRNPLDAEVEELGRQG